jgi:hypothetical protein
VVPVGAFFAVLFVIRPFVGGCNTKGYGSIRAVLLGILSDKSHKYGVVDILIEDNEVTEPDKAIYDGRK